MLTADAELDRRIRLAPLLHRHCNQLAHAVAVQRLEWIGG